MGKLSKTRKNPKRTEKKILIILLLVFVTHLNSIFQKEFVFDDRNRDSLTKLFLFIQERQVSMTRNVSVLVRRSLHRRAIQFNPLVVNGGDLKDYFKRDFWGTELKSPKSHSSWRPMVTLLFRLEKLCAPSDYLLPIMHLINVFIHLANVNLFHKITKSSFASIIFGCHPMCSEAVNAIVGRADQLITTLTLIILKSQNTRYQFILASISIFIKGIFIEMSPFLRLDRYADPVRPGSSDETIKETGLVLFGLIFLKSRMRKTGTSATQIVFATFVMIYFRFQISCKFHSVQVLL